MNNRIWGKIATVMETVWIYNNCAPMNFFADDGSTGKPMLQFLGSHEILAAERLDWQNNKTGIIAWKQRKIKIILERIQS